MKKTKPAQTIYEQLLEAEQLEKEATARRIELENEVFEYLKPDLTKSEGDETIESFGFSVTVKQPMNYKLDEDKYRDLAKVMPEDLQFHRTRLDLDKTKYSAMLLMASTPEVKKYIKKIQDCVTTKPGKVSIKVKKIQE